MTDMLENERQETIHELSDLLYVVQDMGQRLANETHGEAYTQVRELNERLHQIRVFLAKIQRMAETATMPPRRRLNAV